MKFIVDTLPATCNGCPFCARATAVGGGIVTICAFKKVLNPQGNVIINKDSTPAANGCFCKEFNGELPQYWETND